MIRKMALSLLALVAPLSAAEFKGWQDMRVIRHEGGFTYMEKVDLHGNGREALLLLNRRNSRVDIYRYLDSEQRKAYKADPDRPNDLPMAEDFVRQEINFDRLPLHMCVANLDADKTKELLIITTSPLTLHRYDFNGKSWDKSESWKLIEEETQYNEILVHKNKAYISSKTGVQTLELKAGAKVQWMQPREKSISREKWWLHDINDDGEKDLVDLISNKAGELILRWAEAKNNSFLPAVKLGDIEGDDLEIAIENNKPVFYYLNAVRRKTVSSYELTLADESVYARNRLLPLISTSANMRTSIQIKAKNYLLEGNPTKPQMRMAELDNDGFSIKGNFPILRNTIAITSPIGTDLVLLRTKNGETLYMSKWENKRFSFPQPFMKDESTAAKKILNMQRQADILWWVQSVGEDLHLYIWKANAAKALKTVFPKVGKNVDQVQWLGDAKIMVRKKYAKFANFYSLKDGKAISFNAAHLKDASFSQLRLLPDGKGVRAIRLVDGIIQVLDKDLQVNDQIMLENDLRISDCILVENGGFFVLDTTGKKLHLLEGNDAGLMVEKENFEVLKTSSVSNDPLLGLQLYGKNYLNAPLKGRPFKLKLMQTVDSKTGQPKGEKKAYIHEFDLVDINGDSTKELLLFDYARHQITAVAVSKENIKPL
ncbi:MAG: hypothetical protein HRT88_17855, partial [Lentisphaeraceae bacterium]|nr:hypothetical protein [Lentisphaeraceae bacterium]